LSRGRPKARGTTERSEGEVHHVGDRRIEAVGTGFSECLVHARASQLGDELGVNLRSVGQEYSLVSTTPHCVNQWAPQEPIGRLECFGKPVFQCRL
jgi:hypothetical protein